MLHVFYICIGNVSLFVVFNYVTQNLKAMKSKLLLVMLALPMIMTSCSNDEDELAITRSYDPETMTSRACFNMERPNDAYLYPVVPGTDEWSALNDQGMDAVLKALRVPHSTLRKMSTMGLIQTYLDYPFSGDLHFNNSSSQFPFFLQTLELDGTAPKDIFGELKKRGDVETSIMTFYKSFIYNPNSLYSDLTFEHLNLLASIDIFYKQLNTSEKKEFVKIALEKAEMYADDSFWGTPYACFLIARLMYSENYRPLVEAISKAKYGDSFLNDMDMQFHEYNMILSLGKEFIK